MTTFCDRALEARIEGIAGKKRQDLWMVAEALVGAVIVDERLETGGASSGIS